MAENNQLQDILGLSTILSKLESLQKGIDKLNVTIEAFQKIINTDETKSQMAEVFSNGLKNLLSDEDTFRLVVAVLGDSIYDFVIKASQDEKFQAALQKSAISVMTSEAVKGSVSESFFSGVKRLSTDGEFKTAVTDASNDIVKSQVVSNRVNEMATLMVNGVKGFFTSEAFKTVMSSLLTHAVAEMKDTLQLSTSDMYQEMRKLKLQVTLVGEEGQPAKE